MSKSKSHPCKHPRTAVTATTDISLTSTVYYCKKCGESWSELEPKLVLEDSDVQL